MLEIIYKMQPLDYVYLLVGIILFIFALTNKSYYGKLERNTGEEKGNEGER